MIRTDESSFQNLTPSGHGPRNASRLLTGAGFFQLLPAHARSRRCAATAPSFVPSKSAFIRPRRISRRSSRRVRNPQPRLVRTVGPAGRVNRFDTEESMKHAMRIFSVALAGALLVALPALDTYLNDVMPLRKKLEDEARKEGLLLSSHIMRGFAANRDDYDILLMQEFKNTRPSMASRRRRMRSRRRSSARWTSRTSSWPSASKCARSWASRRCRNCCRSSRKSEHRRTRWPVSAPGHQPRPCIHRRSSGVTASSSTPAPIELPTRNWYSGILVAANRLSAVPAK